MGQGRKFTVAGLLVAFLALPGCGFTPPKTAQVAGKVVFRGGGPVANANLQFLPDPPAGNPYIANATTGPNGAFTLHTYLNETRSTLDGAVPGKYKVEVTGYSGATRVPRKYGSPTETPLKADVPQGGALSLNLELDGGL